MNIIKKSSLLFLLCTGIYLMLSLALSAFLRDVSQDAAMLISSIAVSIPAFLLPALWFRRRESFPRFKAPPFTHILIAAAIGVGSVLMNEALSLITGGIFYGVEIQSNSTTAATIAGMDPIVMIVSLVLIPPVSEEFIMRGTLLESFLRGSPVWGAVLTSLLFALLHAAPSSILIYFGLGMVFAFVYIITRNVWLTMTVHLVNNLSAVILALTAADAAADPDALIDAAVQDIAALPDPHMVLYLLNGISLAIAAGAIIVPLIFLLKSSCKKRGLGMYRHGEDSLEDGSLLPLEEGMQPAGRRPELIPNAYLWLCLGLLIVLNVISGLSEFGVLK